MLRVQVYLLVPHGDGRLTDGHGRLDDGLRAQWELRWLTLHENRVYLDQEARVRLAPSSPTLIRAAQLEHALRTATAHIV